MKQIQSRFFALIAAVIILGVTAPAHAFQPASMGWDAYFKKAELVAWVKLVKWEMLKDGSNQYTFEVVKTYLNKHKVAKYDSIELTIALSKSKFIGPVTVNGEGFLMLRKVKGAWATVIDGRGWWPHTYVMKPDYNTFIHVQINDLIQLPEAFKKLRQNKEVVSFLINRKEHKYTLGVYLRDTVDAFLSKTTRSSSAPTVRSRRSASSSGVPRWSRTGIRFSSP